MAKKGWIENTKDLTLSYVKFATTSNSQFARLIGVGGNFSLTEGICEDKMSLPRVASSVMEYNNKNSNKNIDNNKNSINNTHNNNKKNNNKNNNNYYNNIEIIIMFMIIILITIKIIVIITVKIVIIKRIKIKIL